MLPSLNRGRAADESDTGAASLNQLTIDVSDRVYSPGDSTQRIKSITLNNVVMTESADGDGYHRVLNNNSVAYGVDYVVGKAGRITLVFTLPINSTIDASSVAVAAGCASGSVVQPADVGGQKSYTNNRAICIVNPTTTGIKTWRVNAMPHAANMAKITPTLTIGGVGQSIPQSPTNSIVMLGQPAYCVYYRWYDDNYRDDQFDLSPRVNLQIATRPSCNSSAQKPSDYIGVEPMTDRGLSINLDTSGLPSNYVPVISGSHISWDSVVKASASSAVVTYSAPCSASYHCGEYSTNVVFKIPLKSLTADKKPYTVTAGDVTATGASGQTAVITRTTAVGGLLEHTWQLSNHPDSEIIYENNVNGIYRGRKTTANITMRKISSAAGDKITNVYQCYTWNPQTVAIDGEVSFGDLVTGQSIEYGVVGNDFTVVPDSSGDNCGRYGDSLTGQKFFKTLAEARSYASAHNAQVNAFRVHIPSMTNMTGWSQIETIPLRGIVGGNFGNRVFASSSIMADDLAETTVSGTQYVSTGAVGLGAMTAVPSDTKPNTEDHITITPYSVSQDTNVKIVVNLPKGLQLKSGSVKRGTTILQEGKDYTVINNANGTSVVTFNMGTVGELSALDSDGLPADTGQVNQTPIEFDVLVSPDISTPNTLTIYAYMDGVGSNGSSGNFLAGNNHRSVNLAVAAESGFGYGLTVDKAAIGGDDAINYIYTNANGLSVAVNNFDEVAVLPYNGDSRGTSGLDEQAGQPYRTTSFSRGGNTDLELSYTTDTKVRQLEKDSPSQITSDSTIVWTKCVVDDSGNCINLPEYGVTAIRWQKASMPRDYHSSVTIKLSAAKVAKALASINNDITYVTASGITPSSHVGKVTTIYKQAQLGLVLDNPNPAIELKPGDKNLGVTSKLSLVAADTNGWTLTVSAPTGKSVNLMTTKGDSIPAVNGEPGATVSSWALKARGGSHTDWFALPDSSNPAELLTGSADDQSAELGIIYGVGTRDDTAIGEYSVTVVYTITAEL